ncbi:MAG: DUF1178 family protein [Rhodoferax sp.]|nr:DUF1178 family protein [Rhodoferax sp.]
MKVLDLQCSQHHVFEGWFASEADFASQCERALVQCPLCGDPSVTKMLSAPRLNLSGAKAPPLPDPTSEKAVPATQTAAATATPSQLALAAAWAEVSRRLAAETTDVGDQFAEQARKIHYGEAEVRAIRGSTTLTQARDLVEEGIDVIPLLLPESMKGPLQ